MDCGINVHQAIWTNADLLIKLQSNLDQRTTIFFQENFTLELSHA